MPTHKGSADYVTRGACFPQRGIHTQARLGETCVKEDKCDIKILIPGPKKTKRNGELLPDSIRCIIVGPSGCGKTTLMIDNFLLSPGWLDLQDRYVYIYTKSLNQPK